ncbi:DNA repair protein endonuclease SAE2/CtIP C-terminus-domain-containing protein [Rhypophila decipiens]|uniref:DNA repair protein endonuclease SAE2/CtIP C-terminus-domain-containing protein n=1 Tax=Rhypophila decipiens TaxID=261697 RepID=A0AAN6YMX8_9PEZI|nr:DNA repair protein endonuclease SAE2/CtIP C-terminus-domain-containing protein [Rhypophila decipiens]
MGYWNEEGRPAIMAAVEAACDAVAETLTAEMRERDRTRHAFLADEVDRLKASAARASELEQENLTLMRQMNELRDTMKQTTAPVILENQRLEKNEASALPGRNGKRQPLGELPLNVITGQLQTKKGSDFSALEKANADLLQKLEVKRAAARHLKDQRDAWMKYAESLEKKVARLKGKILAHDKPDIPTPTVSRADTADDDDPPHDPSPLSSFVSNPEQESRASFYPEALDELRDSRRAASTPATLLPGNQKPLEQRPNAPRLAEEETWSGDEAEESDELPRLPTQPVEENIARIKQEPSSDRPIVVSERALRKRKNVNHGSGMPPARRLKTEHNGSSDPVITGTAAAFSPHSSIDLDGEQGEVMTPRKLNHFQVETPTNRTLTERRRQPLQELPTHVSDDDSTPIAPETRYQRPREEVGRPLPATDDDDDEALANGVAALAEDRPPEFHPRSSKTGKLQSLLNARPLGSDPVIPLRTPSSRTSSYLPQSAVALGDRRAASELRAGTAVGSTSLPGTAKRQPETPSAGHPRRQKPLRERPVSELKLEDFKINPKFNHGHTHAYNEVVRSRAERAELEGCTDPNCCGRAFSTMAQSELGFGGLDILKKPENIKLLEDYLGDDAYRLGSMAVNEKKELWLEAKTQDYAKRLGKHRHRFGRPPSPPGYWNPDFPSTQEVEARRKEGQEMESKMVEERWREATRGGGRWLFRDE